MPKGLQQCSIVHVIPAICFSYHRTFGYMCRWIYWISRLFHLLSWCIFFLIWHCVHMVPFYCSKVIFSKHWALNDNRYGLYHFHANWYFVDPMRRRQLIAVLWQIAVILFGHEMPPLTLRSKERDKRGCDTKKSA